MLKQFYEEMNESLPTDIASFDVRLLIRSIRNFLKDKRYIVVLDDVWSTEVWDSIKLALPINGKGSRVMMTSRSDDVASFGKEHAFDQVYKLQPLCQEKSWELFCKKTFNLDWQGSCPPELEELSHKIVKKCEGLPLAIVEISGVLLRKGKYVHEWQRLHDNIGIELECNPHLSRVKTILTLSYHDLPYYLKSSLLWFALFPEDYFIDRRRLVRLWAAEGFVQHKEGNTLEESANDHLKELIVRSLVQVAKINILGQVESVRIHDLMREIILSKSRELNFSQVLDRESSIFEKNTRRLSVQCSGHNLEESRGHYRVRSLHLFNMEQVRKSLANDVFPSFHLLRVLDFEGALLNHIPERVGDMIHLRYLSVKGTQVKVLPRSIGRLFNLQTLDLRETSVFKLPFQIERLSKLRHLLSTYGLEIQGDIGCLVELQELFSVDAKADTNLTTMLRNLRQLRTLSITRLGRKCGATLWSAIDNMSHLLSLRVQLSDEGVINLQRVVHPPKYLRRLQLVGHLEKLPSWISSLRSLIRVELFHSKLIDDPLEDLQALPNLLELHLDEAYGGGELHFEAGGFQKLKLLSLVNMNELALVKIDRGSMPLLAKLELGNCRKVKELPCGVEHLTGLKYLEFCDIPKGMVLSMIPDEGQDYCKVMHIPHVRFYHPIDDTTYCYVGSLNDSGKLKKFYSSVE